MDMDMMLPRYGLRGFSTAIVLWCCSYLYL